MLESDILKQKYKIKNPINSGSFGNCFQGEIIENNASIIIKKISKSKPNFQMKIQRETLIPKLIIHPNIITIIDSFFDDDFHYIIYPAIKNYNTLTNFINGNTSNNLAKIIQILCKVVDGIEFMHKNMVIHRDIKPDNIIVNDSEVLIIDFDLAFVMNNDEFPAGNTVQGTPWFLAPEMWIQAKNIDYKVVDVYAFGILCYYVFNFERYPYLAETLKELEYAIIYKLPLESASGNYLMDKLIMKIIRKNPLRRPSLQLIRESLMGIIS